MATSKTKQQSRAKKSEEETTKLEEEVQLKFLPLDTLQEWDRNPKGHDVGLLIHSLKTYGLVRPPAINLVNEKLIYGHGLTGALRIMKQAGDDPPRRVGVDPKSGDWLIPCHVVDLEEPLHEPYLVVDNRSTELGGWDFQMLPEMLEDIASRDLLEVTGFDSDDIAEMIKHNEKEAFTGHTAVGEEVAFTVPLGLCPECGHKFPLNQARKLWDAQNKESGSE